MGRNVKVHTISHVHVHLKMLNVLCVNAKLVTMAEEFMRAFIVKLPSSVRMINLHMKWSVGLKSVTIIAVSCQRNAISYAGNVK